MDLLIRAATRADVPRIVALLADDPLGRKRKRFTDPLPAAYYDAFAAITADSNNELVVVERTGEVIGVLQITFIPYLTYQGGWRALIEGVRVAASPAVTVLANSCRAGPLHGRRNAAATSCS